MYKVLITIDPHSEVLPRFPGLVIGDRVIGGGSSLRFNIDNDSFEFGAFTFLLDAKSIDEAELMLKDAYLTVGHALFRVVAEDAEYTSSIKELSVNLK